MLLRLQPKCLCSIVSKLQDLSQENLFINVLHLPGPQALFARVSMIPAQIIWTGLQCSQLNTSTHYKVREKANVCP